MGFERTAKKAVENLTHDEQALLQGMASVRDREGRAKVAAQFVAIHEARMIIERVFPFGPADAPASTNLPAIVNADEIPLREGPEKATRVTIDSINHGVARVEVARVIAERLAAPDDPDDFLSDDVEVRDVPCDELGVDAREGAVFLVFGPLGPGCRAVEITSMVRKQIREQYGKLLRSKD
jgi:hypothetical protein